ncbi:MAG: O-antigen ligase family protein [Gammaproteobacteria bacterium]|nr:O-antigen ligase family protein [Gammaproteobacteria bacterium]MBU1416645.1 O-antigen ligase family protein [Gammaproteobacteria bacterium]
MPEHLRSLIVILILASVVFSFAKIPLCGAATTREDFARRRNLWFAVTLIAFLAHEFWIYIVVVGVLLAFANGREPNRLALYLTLLFAVPPISAAIGGMGVMQHFFEIDYLRLLALVILLPKWWTLRRQPDVQRFGATTTDKFLVVYLVLRFLLRFQYDSATDAFRYGFYYFTDAFLPYYVASRTARNIGQLREAMAMFVLASMLLACIGVFEFIKQWLLYSPLAEALSVGWNYGDYLGRGEGLRALASTGQPIVLGFVMVVALGFYGFLWQDLSTRWGLLGLVVLVAGLLAPLSRGPWLGAMLLLVSYVAVGTRPIKQFVIIGIVFATLSAVLILFQIGGEFIQYLPFVGTVDAENVTYRERLLDNSLTLIGRNPFFGDPYYYLTPEMEEMRQGQGIIDVVNTYVAIALSSGLIGLTLFIGIFLGPLVAVSRNMRTLSNKRADYFRLGQSLLATLVAVLFMISTVSSILAIETVSWIVAGLAMAYVGIVGKARFEEKSKVPYSSELGRGRDY